MLGRVLFFDDGGVLNKNAIRKVDWQLHVGDFFADKYGGDRQKWRMANKPAFQQYQKKWKKQVQTQDFSADIDKFVEKIDREWLRDMFKYAEVSFPEMDESEEIRVILGSEEYVIQRLTSMYPGTVEVMNKVKSMGYQMNIASGSLSRMIDPLLTVMGIRDHFQSLYCPDTINSLKGYTNYHPKILEIENLKPHESIFIEDRPNIVNHIKDSGALVIQSRLDEKYEQVTEYAYTDNKELPSIISEINNNN